MAVSVQMPLPIPPPQPGAGGEDVLTNRLLALLERRGRPLEVGQIASQLLRLRGCPERLQRRLVAQIVEADARLAWHGRDLVGIAPDGWGGKRIDEATFCVVDLETTGGTPGSAKVTEIGAVRVSGMTIVERFHTLVDPERPIPEVITGLTGITQAMVDGAPTIDSVLDDFAEFAGDDVLVAHNAPFDLRFLNYERRRLAGRYFTQPWLDTLVLSRRLLRGRIDRHNLATVSGWAGTSVRPCHRALPDAEATAEVLIALIPLLAERQLASVESAVRFGSFRAPRYSHKLALAEDLPQEPGVYLLRDGGGNVLYVGKAANLRRRVRSYFGPGGRHSGRIGRALERLERVDHEVLGSEFEALLRESELIHALRPPCNRRGVNARGQYLKLTIGDQYPRLFATTRIADDDALYLGPVRSGALVRDAVACLHALYPLRVCHPVCAVPGAPAEPIYVDGCCDAGPCRGEDPDAYAAVVAEVIALLNGDPEAIGGLGARHALAVADGRWSASEEHRDRFAAVLRLLSALARARALARSRALILEPAANGDILIFFVARGRVIDRGLLVPRGWRMRLAEGLARIGAFEAGPAELLTAQDLDRAALIEERLSEEVERPGVVRLADGWNEPAAAALLKRELRRLRRQLDQREPALAAGAA